MQGIFQKENTGKALKYGIYRHLPTYEKIIRNLVSFYLVKYCQDLAASSWELADFTRDTSSSNLYLAKQAIYSDSHCPKG